LPILIATSLLHAHPFELAFGFGCVLVLALHFNDQRLLLGEPPFSFDDLAFDLAQLIVYRRRVHRDPRAAVLRSTPQISFRLLLILTSAARYGLDRSASASPSTQLAPRTFRLIAIFSRSSIGRPRAMLLADHFGGSGSPDA
jgi:hypothetical protein